MRSVVLAKNRDQGPRPNLLLTRPLWGGGGLQGIHPWETPGPSQPLHQFMEVMKMPDPTQCCSPKIQTPGSHSSTQGGPS